MSRSCESANDAGFDPAADDALLSTLMSIDGHPSVAGMRQRAKEGSTLARQFFEAHQLIDAACAIFRAAPMNELTAAQLDDGLAKLMRAHQLWDTEMWTQSSAALCSHTAAQRVRMAPNGAHRDAQVFLLRDMNHGNMRKSYQEWSKLASQYPKDAEILFSLGCLCGFIGEPQKGVETLQRAISIDAKQGPSWQYVLGGALRVAKKYAKSAAAFAKFLAWAPADHRHVAEAHYGIGCAILLQGPGCEVNKARRHYQAGLDAEHRAISQ